MPPKKPHSTSIFFAPTAAIRALATAQPSPEVWLTGNTLTIKLNTAPIDASIFAAFNDVLDTALEAFASSNIYLRIIHRLEIAPDVQEFLIISLITCLQERNIVALAGCQLIFCYNANSSRFDQPSALRFTSHHALNEKLAFFLAHCNIAELVLENFVFNDDLAQSLLPYAIQTNMITFRNSRFTCIPPWRQFQISEIHFQKALITEDAALLFFQPLSYQPTLQTISLRNTVLDDSLISSLTNALPEIRILSLDIFGASISETNLARLGAILGDHATFQELICNYDISDESMSNLLHPLARSRSLIALILSPNDAQEEKPPISESKLSTIIELLSTNTSLLKLEIEYAKIGDKEATILASGLEASHILQELNLAENEIGDDGAIALAAALEKSSSWRVLNLEGNRIEERGAQALIDVLTKIIAQPDRNQEQLTVLTDNSFSEDFAHRLPPALNGRVILLAEDDEGSEDATMSSSFTTG